MTFSPLYRVNSGLKVLRIAIFIIFKFKCEWYKNYPAQLSCLIWTLRAMTRQTFMYTISRMVSEEYVEQKDIKVDHLATINAGSWLISNAVTFSSQFIKLFLVWSKMGDK